MPNSILEYYCEKLSDMVLKRPWWVTDKEVVEIVPRYYIRVPIPHFYKNLYGELVISLSYKTLFTLGKKKQKRSLYIWEVNNKKGKTIKFEKRKW